ncbi:MAG: cytochrome c [Blastocatellales bacterium]
MFRRIISVSIVSLGLVLMLFMTLSFDASATQKGDKNAKGRQLYVQYCASCHGVDGKGYGPTASALKGTMPDLTMIPKVDGKFPSLRVLHAISGDKEVVAHGSKEMPVWGQVFKYQKGESTARLQIYALEEYIKSIQR